MVSRANWRAVLGSVSPFAVIFWLLFGLIVALAFAACASTQAQKVAPNIVYLETRDFKFYDQGFIKDFGSFVRLEIFNAGNALVRLDASMARVCIDGECYAGASVARKFFGDDLLMGLDFGAVLKGQPIFTESRLTPKNGFLGELESAPNELKKAQNGFTQTLRRGKHEISYQVDGEQINFSVRDVLSGQREFVLEIVPTDASYDAGQESQQNYDYNGKIDGDGSGDYDIEFLKKLGEPPVSRPANNDDADNPLFLP